MPNLSTLPTWVTLAGVAVAVIGMPILGAAIATAVDRKRARSYFIAAVCACVLLAVVATLLLVKTGFRLSGSAYTASLGGSADGWTANDFCVDESDGLHIKPLATQGGLSCLAPYQESGDLEVAVDVRQIAGPSNVLYGLILRYHDTGSTNTYEFVLDGSGNWQFNKVVEGQFLAIQPGEPNAAIHPGLDADNHLDVQAKGGHFTFAINGTQVGTADDGTLSTGVVGVTESHGCETVFSNFSVTPL